VEHLNNERLGLNAIYYCVVDAGSTAEKATEEQSEQQQAEGTMTSSSSSSSSFISS